MNAGRILVGGLLVGVGTLALLSLAGAGEVVLRGWPVLVVGLGALQLSSDRKATPAGVGIVLAGLALLGSTTGVLGGAGDLVPPVVLVGGGLWVALGLRFRGEPIVAGARVGAMAAFGSRRVVSAAARFEGGWAAAFFGHLDLDLTAAVPVASGADLSVTVVLGGADVVVPDGWAVVIRGLPLFGGWDDTTRHVDAGTANLVLRVNALAVFGGVEVKHRDRWS